MKKLSVNEIHSRLEALVARRKASKAIKFINSNHARHALEFEMQGEV